MKEFENNAYFWQKVDTLYYSGDFKLIAKKGDSHPKFPKLTYPCDYGHIVTLASDEGGEVEVYRGKKGEAVETIVVCADILEKRFEVKVLTGLTEEEEEEVLHFLNQTDSQKSVVIRKGKDIPSWAITE